MHFTHRFATTLEDAVAAGARHTSERAAPVTVDLIAGGTDMLQLLQEHLRVTDRLVDLTRLPGLDEIVAGPDELRLGALVRMADAAAHPALRARVPVVVEALEASASAQVRNLATLGGNLLQRTRCGWFRDPSAPCNKREPRSGCPAMGGPNRMHAVLGTSDACIATYGSDVANALLALDATLDVAGPAGVRRLPLAALHVEPGDAPHVETTLGPGEVIIDIRIPDRLKARRSHYLKIRDRGSFQWAVASAAVVLDLDDRGTVRAARIAVAGVATRPWRLPEVEEALRGRVLDARLCRSAGALASRGAVTRGGNDYKAPLLERTVARALRETADLA